MFHELNLLGSSPTKCVNQTKENEEKERNLPHKQFVYQSLILQELEWIF